MNPTLYNCLLFVYDVTVWFCFTAFPPAISSFGIAYVFFPGSEINFGLLTLLVWLTQLSVFNWISDLNMIGLFR